MEGVLAFPQIIDGLSAPIATTTGGGRVELVDRQFLACLSVLLDELKALSRFTNLNRNL
jgi:hypothetical protein